MKKMTFEQKMQFQAAQMPEATHKAPFLPVLVYMIERGCIAKGQSIPVKLELSEDFSNRGGRVPVQQNISRGFANREQNNPVQRTVGGDFNRGGHPPLMHLEGHTPFPELFTREPSDLDTQFERVFQTTVSPEMSPVVLRQLSTIVANYHSLSYSAKAKLGHTDLLNLDPRKKYDSHSFKPYFTVPAPLVMLEDDSLPPQIDDLKPLGIPGGYKANGYFDIAGKGFALEIGNNKILISQIVDLLKDPDIKKQEREEELIKTISPSSVPSTKDLKVLVPQDLPAGDYFLTVQTIKKGITAVSNKVDFTILPNPTVVVSPEIITDAFGLSAKPGDKLYVSGFNIGPAKILHAGQGVALDQTTIPVFIEAHLISKPTGNTTVINETETNSPIIHSSKCGIDTKGDLQIHVPDNILPGEYKLQLVALNSPGIQDQNIIFDEKGGASSLVDLTITAPSFTVNFVQIYCAGQTSEWSPTDEIQASTFCMFDTSATTGVTDVHDMKNETGEDTVTLTPEEGLYNGSIKTVLSFGCSLFEVDKGGAAECAATVAFIGALCGVAAAFLTAPAIATLLAAPEVAVAAAVLVAASGLADAISGLISALGNADDPLGSFVKVYTYRELWEATRNGGKLANAFEYTADGRYFVNYEISRAD